MSLRAVFGAVSAVHQSLAAELIVITDANGANSRDVAATIYREKVSWRNGDRGKERVVTRDLVLPPDETEAGIGSVFFADGNAYTIEAFHSSASGRRRATGRRVSTTERTRPGYRGNA